MLLIIFLGLKIAWATTEINVREDKLNTANREQIDEAFNRYWIEGT